MFQRQGISSHSAEYTPICFQQLMGQPIMVNIVVRSILTTSILPQIAKFMGPTWGPPGSCRPQIGPMLTPWTLLSGTAWLAATTEQHCKEMLTHWGRVTHICVVKLTIIASDNGLSPERRQAIIWTNAGILLIGPLGTNFSEILIVIQTFSLKKIRLKMSSAKCSFCLGLNVLSS